MLNLSPADLKTNLLSGLTVALAMVPEAIAFALIAQVSPLTGLRGRRERAHTGAPSHYTLHWCLQEATRTF